MGRDRQPFRGRFFATLAVVLACASSGALAEPLCAYRNEAGSIVYTNTPTNEGACPSASSATLLAPASSATIARYDAAIKQWSEHYGVSSRLVHAVVSAESAYNPGAVSPKGARGLMQLMPATARRYGVRDSFDATDNIRGGVAHLRDLLDEFGGDTKLAVAAYNAGSGAVLKHSGVPPYAETRHYVARVMGNLKGRSAGLTRPATSEPPASPVRLRVDQTGTIALVN